MTRACKWVWVVSSIVALAPLHALKAQATYGLELIFDDGFQPPLLTVTTISVGAVLP